MMSHNRRANSVEKVEPSPWMPGLQATETMFDVMYGHPDLMLILVQYQLENKYRISENLKTLIQTLR